ncbi:MAG TPA: YqgE/AlgH family protein [Gammaproteobacteria bacterium]|nr:YqgE/AlgH family protein [Gammaproteobacteria bacterium]
MSKQSFLTNQFLIAMPTLGDPNFHETVTWIWAHNAEGAAGVVINRPMEITLGEVFSQLELEVTAPEAASQTVFAGGPVQQQRGFVVHRPIGEWQGTMQVADDIGITSSQDIVAAMAQGNGPADSLFALGCAGWGAGQLEEEFAANAWLTTAADASLLFDTPPGERWRAAARLIGIDINMISGDAGHA